MKILVCVKEVFRADIFDSHQGTNPGKRQAQMNGYDLYAVEEGVLLKDKFPGTRVDALTAGPESSSPVIRKALEMGADNGIHILFDESSSTESSSVAPSIADFIRSRNYDLIITGVLSEDSLQGEMGGLLSGKLNIPYIHSAMKLDIHREKRTLSAESEIDGGTRVVYRLPLPALVSVQSGINTPRYPTLTNKLRAKKQKLTLIHPGEREVSPRGKMRTGFYRREISPGGVVLEGSREEKAETLLRILHEKRLLR